MPVSQKATFFIAIIPIIDPNGLRERPILIKNINGISNFSPELSTFIKVFKSNKSSRFTSLNLDTESVND
jgi:hypothetical protein